MGDVTSKVDEAKSQEAYFLDVINYFNKKLQMFEKLENALERE
jgi:hypothetical protein